MQSPYKDLKRAIINVIFLKPSTSTQNAFQNSKAKRKRVQAKPEEVLNSEEVAVRLKVEEEERKDKKCKKKKNGSKLKSELTKEVENQIDQTSIPLSLFTSTISAGD